MQHAFRGVTVDSVLNKNYELLCEHRHLFGSNVNGTISEYHIISGKADNFTFDI